MKRLILALIGAALMGGLAVSGASAAPLYSQEVVGPRVESVAFWGWDEGQPQAVAFWGWGSDVPPVVPRGIWPFPWPTLTPLTGVLPWPSLLSPPDQTP